jgi:hypothetical protein
MTSGPTHRPYHQNADQREREAVLKNDARAASTFLDHTHSEEGGRFAKPQNVIGSEPTPQCNTQWQRQIGALTQLGSSRLWAST